MNKLRFAPLGLVFGVSLSIFSAQAANTESSIRIAYFGQDIPAADSIYPSFDPDSYAVVTQIFDSLIHADLDGNLVPGLATSWKRRTSTEWVFTLRKGVKFHNGEAFDADAVKFTFDYILNPDNKAGNAWIFSTIKEVKTDPSNPFEVTFKTSVPDGMFLNRFIMFGSICPPKYIQEKGIDAFHNHPVGTGPFKFEKWEKSKEISLIANKDYWQPGIPRLDRVRFLIIPENKWVTSLEKDEVDFVPNLAGNLTRKLVANGKANVRIIKRLVLAGYWVLLKNSGPLADLKVRKALNHAIDKESLVKFADFGNAKPLASLGKSGEFGANDTLQPYAYDPEKAKALLAQAGYKNGLSLNVLAADTAGSVANILKTNLSAIGVTVNLEIVPRSEVIQRVVVHKILSKTLANYDLVIVLVDNPIYNLAFHAGLFLASQSPWSLLNYPEFDARFKEAIETVDEKQHKKRLEELDRYIHENALMLFTTQKIITAAVKRNFSIDKFDVDGHLDYEILTHAFVKPTHGHD